MSLVLLSYIIDEEDRGIYSVPLRAPDLVILMRRRGRGAADSMAAAHWSDRYSVLAALFVDQAEPGLHLFLIAVIGAGQRSCCSVASDEKEVLGFFVFFF